MLRSVNVRNHVIDDTRCPQCATPFGSALRVPYPEDPRFDGLAECPGCALVTLLPQQTPEQIASIYEGHGNWKLLSDAELRVPNERRRARIEALHGGAPGSVYDVGVSHGAFLETMQRAGWTVGGLEPAPNDAEHTMKRLGISLDVGFFGPDTTFEAQHDVVTCWDVLEHMLDPADCLRAMLRGVRPGGLLVFAIPHIDGAPARMLGERWRYTVPPQHIHFFPMRWLERQAAANECDIVAVDGFAKVHAWAQAAIPRTWVDPLIRAMPHQDTIDEAPDAASTRANAKHASLVQRATGVAKQVGRRAILEINQRRVPLAAADLIDVIVRKRSEPPAEARTPERR